MSRRRCQASTTATRACAWCGLLSIEPTARGDARFGSQRCRQASHRFTRGAVARARAEQPLRLAYADPPYPGMARRYYADHPDYAGEVDHAELLSRLQRFDGWALSTSAAALPYVLSLCTAADVSVRVAAWFRGARPTRSAWPLNAWEPVVFAGGRQVIPSCDTGATRRLDALVKHSRPRLTDPARVIGAKPAEFAWWLFDLLGALPGDELEDVFPGSGGIGRAWAVYTSRTTSADASHVDVGNACAAATRDASARAHRDVSHVDGGHASLLEHGHASRSDRADTSHEYSGHASRRDPDDKRRAA